ncbi:hypothetical protein [Spirosoma rigui]|uniref:hypothetical protein n=1 Tax=Spirosoma rigui TaxID=564064 RepID=UPI0009B1732C|nr:hypothetical protein [Spirosoma rigui]
MSTLKNRIRLQQARTQFDRGHIKEEEFARIEIECTTGTDTVIGEPGEGIQIQDDNKLPPVAIRKPATRSTSRKPSTKASTAQAGSAAALAVVDAGENSGNV